MLGGAAHHYQMDGSVSSFIVSGVLVFFILFPIEIPVSKQCIDPDQ